MGFGFDFGFDLFEVLFTLCFVAVFGLFVVTAIRGIRRWNRNNHSPRLTVPAAVVAKRTNISRRHHMEHHHTHTSTSYYVTFQVESGDRMELQVDGTDYGLLVEGDSGSLTFQGTRFLSFDRA